MKAFLRHLNEHDIDYVNGGPIELLPYGQVTIIAVNSPCGNRFEFYEVLAN
jgi:hypothetical protein